MEAVKDLLKSGLSELGIVPDEKIVDALLFYLSELKRWNKAYNLTAITDDREIVAKHFLDSLLYLKALPMSARNLCDVGSGAGFPGLPIALVRPNLPITLIEPSRKRCAFLRNLSKRLALHNVDIIEAVAEEVGELRFDAVLTRATFSIAELMRKADHLLAERGAFILSKGEKAKEELLQVPEGFQVKTLSLMLPDTDMERTLIIATRR
ncbi:MAG TPA: 16S rRNA (guanine(527)-N(7))-methyltransferase RsmG [Dissulfurispiraceae bacterium]|nr:16S rRNA (guanine(527)-N(7))-methyltransferase RsmG [Dissulfurispiraceae bacterium]